MLTLTNAFILLLIIAAAWLGVAAHLQKHYNRWHKDDRVSPAAPTDRTDRID